MGWKLSCPMDEKKEFIDSWLSREFTFSDLCEEFGVSRKTGYKFLARFKAGGMAGLEELSRRPRSHPATTGEEAAALIREMRGRHPTEGAVTLLERIRRKSPGIELPSPSTAHEILRRGGLVGKRRARRFATPTMPGAMAIASSSNHVLSIDFKGDFCMGNGQRCYPLTLTDNYSRFLLRCVGMANQSRGYDEVRAVMEACFLEYGLPSMIRSDNGPPFASTGLNGWSKLSVWWMRLGITPERIMPGKPQQNGRHERMHRTLKARVCKSPGYDMRQQQGMFDDFLQDYNFERPHQALELRTPSELYVPSPRAMPLRIAPADYPAHMDVRKVKNSGRIKLDGREIRLGDALLGEYVGLKAEDDDHTATVYFCQTVIGTIDLREKVWKFRQAKPAMSVGGLAPDSATLHPTPAPPTDIASPS